MAENLDNMKNMDNKNDEYVKYWEIAKYKMIPHFAIWKEIINEGPRVITKGDGVYLWDVNNNKYIDGMSILWVVNVGHNRKEIIEAMYEQLNKISYVSLFGGYYHEKALELSELLTNILGMEAVFFSNSGSEAIETAIKLAKQYHYLKGNPNKYKIIGRWHSYHGVTYGALSLSGIRQNRIFFEPLVPGFLHFEVPYCYRCPFNSSYPECNLRCADDLERLIEYEGAKTIAAVVVEPVMSALGSVYAPDIKEYYNRIYKVCKENDILLIFDEVNNGFGRTGKLFAYEHTGIKPDMFVFGKGITSGYAPLGATVVSKEIAEIFKDWMFMHGYTFGGHPASAAAAIANINIIINEKLYENAHNMGFYLKERLEELREFDIVGDVRGIGLHYSIEYVSDKNTKKPISSKFWVAAKIEKELLKNGVYLARASVDRTYIAPPLIINKDQIDFIINALKKSIYKVQQEFFSLKK